MKNKLIKLYNTMLCIETKGESTKLMADCLRYLGSLVNEADKPEVKETPVTEAESAEG